MEFVELNKDEFTIYANGHPLKSFFQTVEMETMGNYGGWDSYYVGVKEEEKIIAATRMMSYKNRLGYRYFYAPRGFLLDYHNKELLSFFTKQLKQYLKKKKGYMIRIDPTLVHLERDAFGKVKPNGENNEDCVDHLKRCGYIHNGYFTGYDDKVQCRWVYCLDLKQKTEEEILREMNATTRNRIKKASGYAITVREMTYDELPLFKKITEEASIRNHFQDKNLEYYQHMYEVFSKKNEIKYMIAELDTKQYLEQLNQELIGWEDSKKRLSDHPRNQGKRQELQVSIDSTKKKIEQAKMLCKIGSVIPLAASMFLLYGDEILYYHSGNYKEYIMFNGQALIQWHMIKYGLKHHMKRYNFYGIDGNFDSEDGVYQFKRGFGGYVEEYIGDFDLPISLYYYIKKLRKK